MWLVVWKNRLIAVGKLLAGEENRSGSIVVSFS
jgi:hypothetical protein